MPLRPRHLLLVALLAAMAAAVVLGVRAGDASSEAAGTSHDSAGSSALASLAPTPPRVRADRASIDAAAIAPEADGARPFDPECGGTLDATVLAADGREAGGARVVVRRDDGTILGDSDDSKSGSQILWPATPTVSGLPIDEPLVAVATSSAATASVPQPFRIARGARAATLVFSLRLAASIVVHAKDEAGRPIDETLHVRAKSAAGEQDWCGSSVAAGQWRTGDLPAGRWTLRISTASRRAPPTVVDVGPGEAAEVDVRLDRGASIEGVVVDPDGHPLAGALVRAHPSKQFERPMGLEGREATTGDRGEFTLTGFEPGDLRLTAEIAGDDAHAWICTSELVPVTAPAKGVRLVASATTTFSVVLKRPDGSPYSGPVDARIGFPDLTYVQYLIDGPHLTSGPAPAACDGAFAMCDLPGDRATPVVVRVPGFLTTGFLVPPRPGGIVDVGELRLDAGATLTGVVRDAEGRPIVRARVRCDGLADASTDEAGRFTLEHLPPGPASVRVEAEGFATVWTDVEDAADAKPLDIRPTGGALVRARLRDARGRLVRYGRLTFAPVADEAGGAPRHGERAIFASGWIEMDPVEKRLPAGRWRVAVALLPEPDGAESEIGVWTLAEGETRDETIVVPDAVR